MRIAASETAPQIALRNCSKKAGGYISIYVILVKGEYMHSSTYFLQEVSASYGDPRMKEQIKPRRVLECRNGKTRPYHPSLPYVVTINVTV